MVKEKQFYKSILTIGLPIALQNLIVMSINFADTVMLSRAGLTDELVSAADLANKPFFLLIITLFGLSGGGVALASQYWGKGDVKSIRIITAMVLRLGVAISFAAGTAVLLFPAQIMRIFTANEGIIGSGIEYLNIVGWSYYVIGFTIVLTMMLRSVELVRIALYADIAALVVNVFLNWILIFGRLGFPALGIKGAAIGTLIARSVCFIIVCVYVFVTDKRLAFRLKHLFLSDKSLFRSLSKYGFPVLFNECAWALAITVQAMIMGRIDYVAGDAVAANAACNVIIQLFMVVMWGAANAALIIVGKAIGEGEEEKARRYADSLFRIGILTGAAICIAIISGRDLFLGIFGLSPETAALAKDLLLCVGIMSVFASIATMATIGIFRGGGDTRFCLMIVIICIWGVSIPIAALFAFVFHLPLPIVYIGMKLDEVIKTVICSIRIKGDKWLRNLTINT